jgi:amino acid adenylation domain-containing protein
VLQSIAAEAHLQISLFDLSDQRAEERLDKVQSMAEAQLEESFDLSRAPLMRASLYRLSEDDHILSFVVHHIIIDEWSQDIFLRELSLAYAASCDGSSTKFPDLPIHYADFAVWQNRLLESQVADRQLAYWRTKLSGASQILELPVDHPRPPVLGFRGAMERRIFPESLMQSVHRLAAREKTTVFNVLLAAYQVLLFRYTRQEDFLVGTPITNRWCLELETLIGFFLNTLVLRAELNGALSFEDVLVRTSESMKEAFANQDLPFERLVEELKVERDLGRHPLFQTMYVHHPQGKKALELAGLVVSPYLLRRSTAKFDLTLFISEDPHGDEAALEYNTDLFEQATAQRILECFEVLAAGIIADPRSPIAALSLLSTTERIKLLVEWNQTWQEYPHDVCIHQLFEAQAGRTPHSVALVDGDQVLTYQELNARANQLARHLRRHGVDADDLVGIYGGRSLVSLVSLLAILKAGAAYVPLDPGYPQERLKLILQMSNISAILTQERWRSHLVGNLADLICTDSLSDQIALESVENLQSTAVSRNLAYVIYTSGSTGVPKGVAMEHQTLVNLITWQKRDLSLPGGARTLQFTSLNFDVSFQEIFSAWCAGGTLVVVPDEIRLDPHGLIAFIADQQIERVFMPFVALQQLAEAAQSRQLAPPHLKEVITAGEQLLITPQIAWLFSQLEDGRLHNHYGPTETHAATAFTLAGDPSLWPLRSPIGRPIANSRIYLLNDYFQPVPVGVAGELYIGGETISRGYYNSPELTAERFIADPFSSSSETESDRTGGRLYRTGDLARYLPDGNIEFLGRSDFQVKLRGFRVELGEVESVLQQHPGVRMAVVTLSEDGRGDRRLIAYLIASSGQQPDSRELREFLTVKLPDYMIPAGFIYLDELPLTPSGKVDRKNLPAPDVVDLAPGQREAFQMPRDALEASLCQIWESVLGVQVGVLDNYFEIGGHSLLAVRLFNRIEEQLGKRPPMSLLFRAPTVAQLAEALRRETDLGEWEALVAIQPAGSRLPFFCVHNFGGEVLNYSPLAELLGPDQPFYGLQAIGLDGKTAPHTTFQEMAGYYVRAIRVLQHRGPYYLGGYCFGGVLAYEMACQLKASGERVAFVGVIEGSAPGGDRATGSNRLGSFLKNLPFWLGDFLNQQPAQMRLAIRRRLRVTSKTLANRLGLSERVKPADILKDYIPDVPSYQQHLMEIHLQALMNYKPPVYDGRVTLFRVRSRPLFSRYDETMGWGSYARGGVDIQIIPATHHNILGQPQVAILAEKLNNRLEEAQRASS